MAKIQAWGVDGMTKHLMSKKVRKLLGPPTIAFAACEPTRSIHVLPHAMGFNQIPEVGFMAYLVCPTCWSIAERGGP